MDKTFAFFVIGFFILCTGIITWSMVTVEKRSLPSKVLAYGYVAFTWACVITLVVLSIIYRDL